MSTQPSPRLHRAFRLVAGDLPPASDRPFEDPTTHETGRIDKRVVLQTAVWRDRQAQPHQLDAMTHEYRAHVLAFLEREGPKWIHEASIWVIYESLTDNIAPAEASDRLELLDLLTPGWMGHTPLGRRLHQLNGTTPAAMERPPAPLGPGATRRPEILRDTDHGVWRIRTESTTTYLVDLNRRRIVRHPGAVSGDGTRRPASGVHVGLLPTDGEWTELTALVQCRLGRNLYVLDEGPTGPGYRLSTLITSIEPVSDTAVRTATEANDR